MVGFRYTPEESELRGAACGKWENRSGEFIRHLRSEKPCCSTRFEGSVAMIRITFFQQAPRGWQLGESFASFALFQIPVDSFGVFF